MSLQDSYKMTVAIPQSGSTISTGSQNALTIRAKYSTVDPKLMPRQDGQNMTLAIP
jgi:hypothetical protein